MAQSKENDPTGVHIMVENLAFLAPATFYFSKFNTSKLFSIYINFLLVSAGWLKRYTYKYA